MNVKDHIIQAKRQFKGCYDNSLSWKKRWDSNPHLEEIESKLPLMVQSLYFPVQLTLQAMYLQKYKELPYKERPYKKNQIIGIANQLGIDVSRGSTLQVLERICHESLIETVEESIDADSLIKLLTSHMSEDFKEQWDNVKYIRSKNPAGVLFTELPHDGMSMTNCIEEIMEYEGLTKITYLSMSESKWIRASKDEVTGEIKFE